MHLRAPRVGRPARAGIGIGLGHNFHRETSGYPTGGIVGALPPRQPLEESWGGWHRVRVELDGDQLKAVNRMQQPRWLNLGDNQNMRMVWHYTVIHSVLSHCA